MKFIHKLLAALAFAAILSQSALCAAAGENSTDEAWSRIFDPPEALSRLQRPAVVYLYIEHAEIVRTALQKLAGTGKEHQAAQMRKRFAELAGLDCLVVHTSQLVGHELDQPQIKALLISGRHTTDIRPKDEKYFRFLRSTRIPVIGFCGGCQLIGKAFDIRVVPMRRLAPGETDSHSTYHPGMYKETGFMAVDIIQIDPLFAGLPSKPVFKEAHAFQLADVPPGFDLLASSSECRVQAIKDRSRMVYGVQFHPEAYDDQHPDGRTLLMNFFRLALSPPK